MPSLLVGSVLHSDDTEREIPQERQKFERKERKEMSRHNRNKNEGGNKQEDIWRWVTSPFSLSRIANLASIHVENV